MIHKNTPWKTFYHSCGSIVTFLDDFVEAGVDILNPVQTSAKDMDPKMLKERYGDRLDFLGRWGRHTEDASLWYP